ncbi:MAG: hypothetical protein R3E89_18530 [Thiolinea sp.]
MEINVDEALAAAPDGTPASEDFGESLINECFIPQNRVLHYLRLPD